jgi:hypothetical protein
LICKFLKTVYKNETHNRLSVFEWTYRHTIGNGEVIPWQDFVNKMNMVKILTARYVYALRDYGCIFDGSWPEVGAGKKQEWLFNFFLESLYNQVDKGQNTVNASFATQLASSQMEALLYKYQMKYKVTMASSKVQREQMEIAHIQQMAMKKELRTNQEIELVENQLN